MTGWPVPRSEAGRDGLAALVRAPGRALIALDYDGTLVPYASVPELAMPDEGLLALLRALASRPGTEIHLVSGSSREVMEAWFGELPIGLSLFAADASCAAGKIEIPPD